VSDSTARIAHPGRSLWFAIAGAAALGFCFPAQLLVLDVVLLIVSLVLTAAVFLGSQTPKQTRAIAMTLTAVGYVVALVLILLSGAHQPPALAALAPALSVGLVIAGLLLVLEIPKSSLWWILLLLPAAAFIMFAGGGRTADLVAALLLGVLAGIAVALAAWLARRTLVPRVAPAAAGAAPSADSPSVQAGGTSAPARSTLAGYVVSGVGVALVLAGIIWASIVGFYARDLPVLIGLLVAGAVLAWVGRVMIRSSKRRPAPNAAGD